MDGVIALFFAAILLITICQVVLRYGFNASILGAARPWKGCSSIPPPSARPRRSAGGSTFTSIFWWIFCRFCFQRITDVLVHFLLVAFLNGLMILLQRSLDRQGGKQRIAGDADSGMDHANQHSHRLRPGDFVLFVQHGVDQNLRRKMAPGRGGQDADPFGHLVFCFFFWACPSPIPWAFPAWPIFTLVHPELLGILPARLYAGMNSYAMIAMPLVRFHGASHEFRAA